MPFVLAEVDAVPLAAMRVAVGAIGPVTEAPEPKCLVIFWVRRGASAPST